MESPDGALDECGHDGDAEAAAAHDEDLDQLAAALEVLRHHQGRAVAGQPHAHPDHRAWNTRNYYYGL